MIAAYQPRFARRADKLLLYQFEIVHIPGKGYGDSGLCIKRVDRGTVARISIRQKFRCNINRDFYKALYCLSSRLNNTGGSNGKK